MGLDTVALDEERPAPIHSDIVKTKHRDLVKETHAEMVEMAIETGIFLVCYISGVKVRFLVDTGSTTTILSENMFSRLPESERSELGQTRARIILADGKTLNPLGCVTLTLEIGKMSVDQEMIVADIGVEGLIGMDFLRTHKCQLDLYKSCIQLNGCLVPLSKATSDFQCCKVSVTQHVVIPASHEMIVMGTLEEKISELPAVAMITPVQKYSERYFSWLLPRLW